ncbi:MAG: rRNA maturation RNase YbeY [Granulosicoccus sp.]
MTTPIDGDSACRILFDKSTLPNPGDAPGESFIQSWCAAALQAQPLLDLSAAEAIEVSVKLVDAATIQVLNQRYRGKDSSTNVLSFRSDMPLLPDGLMALGDLVLCPEVVHREASEQNKAIDDHWAHMLVHGTLHLCGYDHEELNQAEAMESMEIQILSGSGISDPYRV